MDSLSPPQSETSRFRNLQESIGLERNNSAAPKGFLVRCRKASRHAQVEEADQASLAKEGHGNFEVERFCAVINNSSRVIALLTNLSTEIQVRWPPLSVLPCSTRKGGVKRATSWRAPQCDRRVRGLNGSRLSFGAGEDGRGAPSSGGGAVASPKASFPRARASRLPDLRQARARLWCPLTCSGFFNALDHGPLQTLMASCT